jgi:tetratricopeptide (TPR) repeat protein
VTGQTGVDGPRTADDVYRTVAIAVREGRAAAVLSLARQGVADHPGDARLWQVLGLAHRQLEDLAPAVEALTRAAALAPAEPLIAHSVARVRMEAGLPALAEFDRALALAPDDPSVIVGRAAAQFAEGEALAAIAGLEAQLRRFPGWLLGHGTLARLRQVAGDAAGATESFEVALRVEPANGIIWGALVETLMQADRYEEALAAIARARAAVGASRTLDVAEAVCIAEQGNTARADALFAELGPIEHVALAVRYVRHLLRAGRPNEAATVADQWQRRDPDNLLVPYQSAAWRLTGDRRWQWLEGDPRFIGVYDLAERLPSLDALAEALRRLHLSHHHPLDQSLRGGTQTDGALFSRIEPEIRALRQVIVDTVGAHVAQLPPARPGHPLLLARRGPIAFSGSWSVRLTGAGFHVNHVHPAGWLSSAFYVALPEAAMGGPNHAGWLSIGEATELGLDLPPLRLIEPKPGRLVLFPSTMWHGTRPFAEGERLTVAFDVARPPQ